MIIKIFCLLFPSEKRAVTENQNLSNRISFIMPDVLGTDVDYSVFLSGSGDGQRDQCRKILGMLGLDAKGTKNSV